MTTEEINKIVLQTLAQVAPEADLETLDPRHTFHDQFGLDSVDFLDFVTALEQRLDIRIPDLDAVHLATLEGCLRYLTPRLAQTDSDDA